MPRSCAKGLGVRIEYARTRRWVRVGLGGRSRRSKNKDVPRTPLVSQESLRLFLVDDHSLYRAGLKEAIELEHGMEIVGETETGGGSLEAVIASRAQIVLLDLRLPDTNGIDVCRSIVSETDARCIILTSFHGAETDLVRAAAAGARAYLVKGTGLGELVDAIRSVASGVDLLARSREVLH